MDVDGTLYCAAMRSALSRWPLTRAVIWEFDVLRTPRMKWSAMRPSPITAYPIFLPEDCARSIGTNWAASPRAVSREKSLRERFICCSRFRFWKLIGAPPMYIGAIGVEQERSRRGCQRRRECFFVTEVSLPVTANFRCSTGEERTRLVTGF